MPRGASFDSASGYKSRLPPPRRISTTVFQSKEKGEQDTKHTHMLMQFGQFIDHEITSSVKTGKFTLNVQFILMEMERFWIN